MLGKGQALAQVEALTQQRAQAIARVNHFAGAIDAVDGLIKLHNELEAAKAAQATEDSNNEEGTHDNVADG